MSSLVSWIATAPPSAIAILTTILAATIALIVSVLTQWILGRRARTELLTKKLEELYLVLNEISAHNVKRVEEAMPLISATPLNKPKITGGSVEGQGLDLHKKIIMLVRLYFPKLTTAHQAVFHCNRNVNTLIYEAETGPPLSEEQFIQMVGSYRDAVVAMEEELIRNRDILVKDYLFPVKYKHEPIKASLPPRKVD